MSSERLPDGPDLDWTDEHDEGAPSNLARPGVYRVNVGVDRETFERLVGSLTDPDYAAFDRFVPHPVYAKQRWISILNPSHATVQDSLMPLIAAGHDRLAAKGGRGL